MLATGSLPRRLPAAIGGDLAACTWCARWRMWTRWPRDFSRARVLIVGGGYIGLEAAAVAAQRACRWFWSRWPSASCNGSPPRKPRITSARCTRHGVDIREGIGLERLLGDRVTGARLSDGTEMDVDFVIVGRRHHCPIPPGRGRRAGVDNGIVVDAQGRTSDPAIWAVGDCASFPHRGGRMRLESVPNAIDMAECVADNIMGHSQAYVPQPWFWSDQYDVKLQIAGLNTGYDRIVTRDGGAACRSGIIGAINCWPWTR